MARSLTLSNGELHIGLNESGLVETLHFPYVGHENHTPSASHRIGVHVDGAISWIDDGNWTRKSKYPAGSLIGHTVAVNQAIGIILEFEDFVEADTNLLIRNVHVINIREDQRSVRLFFHQAFTISGHADRDTAQYLPANNSVLHYRGRRAFVASGTTDVGQGFDQYTVGRFGDGMDGTWRDAEDGELSMSAAECGQTDSTIGFSMIVGGLSSRRVHYWLIASTSVRSAISMDATIHKQGAYKRLASTIDWWRKCLNPSFKVSDQLEPHYQKPFIDSLMMLHSHIDRRGAVIRSTKDDANSYCDPGVGAFAIWPLARLGFKQEALNYFNFIRQSLTDEGYLMRGYQADGAISPTNLPYDGNFAPLDSSHTAIALFVFSQVYALHKQPKILKDYYSTLVTPMANFLSDYIDDRGLPTTGTQSLDDAEGLSCMTTSLTYAALMSAVELADYSKDQDSSVKWRTAAEEMRRAAHDTFISNGVLSHSTGNSTASYSGLYGAFMFGLIDIDNPAIARAADQLRDVPVRSDLIGSLWLAQYYMEIGEQAKADEIISEVSDCISTGGHEIQLDTWVYAEFVSTLLDRLTRK